MRRRGVWVGIAVVVGVVAWGHAVVADPVLEVVVAGRRPSPSHLAEAARIAGGAVDPRAAATRLEQALGRPLPADDAQAPVRQAIDAAIDEYYRAPAGTRAVIERLEQAAQSLEGAPASLEAHPADLTALARALTMVARLSLESRHPDDADRALQRLLRVAPGWAPELREFPPPVVQRFESVRDASASQPHGDLVVTVAGTGCQARVDGRETAPGTTVSLLAGAHRVSARCGAEVSRVRTVQVEAGRGTTLAIDPRLDAIVDLREGLALRYPGEADANAHLAGDAALIGRTLEATRVVAVRAQGPAVIDVASGRMSGDGATTPGEPGRRRGAGAGPWVVAGVGVAVLAAGVVAMVLASGVESDLQRQCVSSGDGHACLSSASGDIDRLGTYRWVGAAGLGVGGAAVVGGVLWYLLGRTTTPAPVDVRASADGVVVQVRGRF